MEELCTAVVQDFPRSVFFSGKLVFQEENAMSAFYTITRPQIAAKTSICRIDMMILRFDFRRCPDEPSLTAVLSGKTRRDLPECITSGNHTVKRNWPLCIFTLTARSELVRKKKTFYSGGLNAILGEGGGSYDGREEELLNSRQVAVILDLSPDTVNEFARKNILPAFQKR